MYRYFLAVYILHKKRLYYNTSFIGLKIHLLFFYTWRKMANLG